LMTLIDILYTINHD